MPPLKHGNFLNMHNKRTIELIIVKPRHWKAFLNKRLTDEQFRKKYKQAKRVKR